MYSEKAINRFKNPRFVGEIKNPSGVGEAGNLACGDVIRVYIKVKGDVLEDVRFETYGCVAAIAASDTICGLARGKRLDEVMALTYDDIIKDLGGLPPVKYHCSIMGIEALKKAIVDYQRKGL
ncbi:MAG: iron-sulfur cluster assembly scaffold protein [Candidatus Bilamarchaeaceae archaeon]